MTGELCRLSRTEDVSRLKELWAVCFGDEADYIDHYFEMYYKPERAVVLETAGEIVSMLLTFPFTLTETDGTQKPACYIYAFCTHPDRQGKGYGRRLLSYTEELAKSQGCAATVMVPGEKSLFDFYQSLDYSIGGGLKESKFVANDTEKQPVSPCSVTEYAAEREKRLTGIPHVTYNTETLTYQSTLCELVRVGDGIAAVEPEDETVFVKELLTDRPEQAIQSLLSHFHAERAVVRFPVQYAHELDGGERPFAVIKWLTSSVSDWKNGWLAFGFD